MKFVPLSIAGAYRIDPEPHKDDRGTFVRLFCSEEFAGQGLEFTTSQINLSANTKSHTLRGLHFHAAPYAESKLVRVVRGRAFDVIVDLRPESPSYKCWGLSRPQFGLACRRVYSRRLRTRLSDPSGRHCAALSNGATVRSWIRSRHPLE